MMISLRRFLLTHLQSRARKQAAAAFLQADKRLGAARRAHGPTAALMRAKARARAELLRLDVEIAR